MRAVIAVSLGGRVFQLEDDAHAALAQYLSAAEHALSANPDRAEILADLEQAIADKGERVLSAHKNVMTRIDIDQIIREMGPVTDGIGSASGPSADGFGASAQEDRADPSGGGASPATPKRLYQISDGALLSGVCTGLAVYYDVDVTLVRLIFVVAAVLTGGIAALGYLALMFLVPYADTPEQIAAAGGLPFNARILVEQWKRKAAEFAGAAAYAARADGSPAERMRWHSEWRRARGQWRREWRASRAHWRSCRRGAGLAPPPPDHYPPLPPLAALAVGLSRTALGLLLGIVTVTWVLALLWLFTNGTVFGGSFGHLPLWAAVVILLLLYQVLAGSLRALRDAHSPYFYPGHYRAHGASEALSGLMLFAVLLWLLGTHMPEVQHFVTLLQQRVTLLWQHGTTHSPSAAAPAH